MGRATKIPRTKVVTVTEIKEIDPLANVFQLSPFYSYIITIERSNLAGREANERLERKAQEILKMCNASGIGAFVMVATPDIKFFGFEKSKVKIDEKGDIVE